MALKHLQKTKVLMSLVAVQPIPQRWINHNKASVLCCRNLGPKREPRHCTAERRNLQPRMHETMNHIYNLSATYFPSLGIREHTSCSLPHCLIKPTAYSLCIHFTATFLRGQQWRNNLEMSFFLMGVDLNPRPLH